MEALDGVISLVDNYPISLEEAQLIKFGRLMRLIELIDYLRSSVHAGVLYLRRLTKRISSTSARGESLKRQGRSLGSGI